MQPDDDETPAEYLKALLRRTQGLRERRNYTQAQMASFLGISVAVYKKYETRSPLPHRLINKFCLLADTDETYFLTGKSTVHKKLARKSA
jgi:transcriptional regulator with XRE-family HTH domain